MSISVDQLRTASGDLLRKALFGLREKDHGLSALGTNGRISVVGDAVVISRKRQGLLTVVAVGLHGDKTIPIAAITGVELRKPGLVMQGYLRLSTSGHDPRGGAIEAATDENAVLLKRVTLKDFQAVHDYLVARIGRAPASTSPSSSSVADELSKLAALRDQGILNDEEFAAQKRAVLGA